MSDRSIWKMLHLLYNPTAGGKGLSYAELNAAGITCGPDTVNPLINGGAAKEVRGRVRLPPLAETILGACAVSNRRWNGKDMPVDYRKAYVVMPFGKPWSSRVERGTIRPAVTSANLRAGRDKLTEELKTFAADNKPFGVQKHNLAAARRKG